MTAGRASGITASARSAAARLAGERAGVRLRTGLVEEAPGFVGNIPEVDEAEAFADNVEHVAMLAGCGIGPVAGWSLGRVAQPDIHGSAGQIACVPDQPVIAFAPSVGEVVAAGRLGMDTETAGKF